MSEQWKDVPGYKGRYRISSCGRLRSLYSGEILSWRETNRGYFAHSLWRKGLQKWHYCHRLLAIAFIPNPQRLPEVDHINRERKDNRLRNLRWVSVRQQQMNRSPHPANECGVPGVTRHPSGQWQVRIFRNTYLGIFPSLKHAVACRRKAERLYTGQASARRKAPRPRKGKQ